MKKMKNVLDMDTFADLINKGQAPVVPELNEEREDYTEDELPEDEGELEEENFRPDPVIQNLEQAAFLLEHKSVLSFDDYVRTQYKKKL